MARIRNRRELRDQFDAAEARTREDEAPDTEEEEEEDDDEEEEGDEEAAEKPSDEEPSDEAEGGGGDDDDEVPVKKKKAKAKVVKEPKPKRVRTPKHVRMRVVWGVFNNSNQRVHTFAYPQKTEADEYAAKMKAESKTNQTYFVQPVKEAIEEKKE
jgi:hypothetical protein